MTLAAILAGILVVAVFLAAALALSRRRRRDRQAIGPPRR
jgi:ABC-type transport system involved in cytochrome c biogenesis permease component